MSLVSRRESILKICEVLSEQEDLKVTLSQAAEGGLMVGGAAFVGALLGGPIGLAIGK